jgi:MFS family permease
MPCTPGAGCRRVKFPEVSAEGDIRLLFSTRIVRLFCYGFLSVVLALYLALVGLKEKQIGLLFTLTLAGDAGVSLWLTTSADRFGRKRTLILGALLMIAAGLVFILTRNAILLMAAAIIGVISPSGNEIGPFLSVEQASLTQLVPGERRTQVFAWYNLSGSFATATGALAGGCCHSCFRAGASRRSTPIAPYCWVTPSAGPCWCSCSCALHLPSSCLPRSRRSKRPGLSACTAPEERSSGWELCLLWTPSPAG